MLAIWCFLFFVLLLLPEEIPGKIRYVPGNYPKIQSAIDASSSGDTVIIDAGTYYENLIINKNIVLTSRFILDKDPAHISNTIIDGSKATDPAKSSTILIRGPTDTGCVVTGLSVRGGRGTYTFIRNSPQPNKWIFGGGIAVFHTGARISNNILRGNHLTGNALTPYTFGGGIGTVDTSWGSSSPPLVIIEDNLVIENSAYGKRSESGGIYADQQAVIRYNKVTGNRIYSSSRSSAGGIGVMLNAEYRVMIYGNYIRFNSSGIGGGLSIGTRQRRFGVAMVFNNIIADNKSFEVAGGILLSNEAFGIFINNTIVNNHTLSMGGAVYVARGGYGVFVNNILWRNAPDQIANLANVQSHHNLIENGFPGYANVDSDPFFIKGDTLFRLSRVSPCVSAGKRKIDIAGVEVPQLYEDFTRDPRINPAETRPDLGAVESEYGKKSEGDDYPVSDNYLRLLFQFRQVSAPNRDPVTGEIKKAGEMAGILQVNERTNYRLDNDETPQFELPPGINLIDLEVIARGRDSAYYLNLHIWLEGADQQLLPYNQSYKVFYRHWANLKPGNYVLRIQPQDDEGIIGPSNKRAFIITVPPYWYQRWWAYLIYVLGVIAAAFVYTRLKIRNLEKEQALSLRNLEIEKLTELDKLKSRFLANITHELRTPLTLILGPAETLISENKDKNTREQLGLIRRNAFRLLRLVDMLLQFSRFESGTMKLQTCRQNIVPVLSRVLSYFSSPAAKKNIELSFSSAREDITGYFDEEKVEHIVQNLLSNALKFTPGGGKIILKVSEENDLLTVSVSDTGVGISEQHKNKIFDRFFRVEEAHKTEGTGIGLSLTKEFAELHHGSILVESALGKGSRFVVTIPLSGYSEDEIGKGAPAETSVIRAETESLRSVAGESAAADVDRQIALIAEDNDDAREYISSILLNKYEVMQAPDGAKALEQTRIHLPDIVISDVMMPDMDGFELCKLLKTDEKTCHIPVIMLTALADRKEKLNGLELGADDYLTKPFDKKELLARVHNLLELRKKLRESFSHTDKLKPGEVPVVSLDDKFLKRVMQVAEKHISEENFSVDQFAHEVFMSRMQFYRKLKAVTNLTPNDFLKIVRLERAKQLLTDHFGTIAEVSEAVGFSNHSYFAKSFQAHFGILPHEANNA